MTRCPGNQSSQATGNEGGRLNGVKPHLKRCTYEPHTALVLKHLACVGSLRAHHTRKAALLLSPPYG